MKKVTFDVPAMYGDHHVSEVRRLLLEISGVEEVYATSAFHVVEVTYDPAKTNDLEIQTRLDDTGYLGEWNTVAESGLAVNANDGEGGFFRHTAIYEQGKQVVGFSQNVTPQGRPLWPCPGMGPIRSKGMDEE